MFMHEYNICYSSDSNYAELLAVSIVSILANSDIRDNFNFYILDGGLIDEDKEKINSLKSVKDFNINYIPINAEEFKNCPVKTRSMKDDIELFITVPTYFRLKLSELFPNLDKVLYLDCDILARGSLWDLYNTDITDYANAMVLDAEYNSNAKRLGINKYYNAGVTLMNLDFWRKNDISSKCFEFIKNNKDKILWHDQDVVNVVLKDNIKEIDRQWNFQYFQYEDIDSKSLPDCKIIHLAGRFKPWIISFEHVIYDIYYHYLSYTPWKNKEIEYRLNSSGKYLKNNVGGKKTNIVLMTTDNDLQKTYKDLNSAYTYVNTLERTINADTDIKLSKIYDDFKKVYEYIKEEKEDTYDDFEKVYEYIKEEKKDTEYKLTTDIDEKVNLIYEEITKNYKYTEKLSEEAKTFIKEINDRLSHDNYENTISLKDLEEKYTNIEKLAECQNSLFEEILKNRIEKFTLQTDEKIDAVREEIDKNYKFTEYLVQISEDKQNEIIEKSVNSVKDEINNVNNNVQEQINNRTNELYYYTDTQINNVKNLVDEKVNNTREQINRENDLRFNEIAAYTNEQNARIFKEICEASSSIENTINNKIGGLYKNSEVFNEEINNLKASLNGKIDENTLNNRIKDINNNINNTNSEQNKNLENMKSEFENQINTQRIKYEKKLIAMEKQLEQMNLKIREMKKSPLEKLLDKLKAKPEKRR